MKKKDVTEGMVDFGDWANIPPWEAPALETERLWMQKVLTCRGCKHSSLITHGRISGLPARIENGWIMLNVGWMCEGCVTCPICEEVMFEEPRKWGHTVPVETKIGVSQLIYEPSSPCSPCVIEFFKEDPEDGYVECPHSCADWNLTDRTVSCPCECHA